MAPAPSATSWEADVQIPEPMEDISKSNHYTVKSKENKGKKKKNVLKKVEKCR